LTAGSTGTGPFGYSRSFSVSSAATGGNHETAEQLRAILDSIDGG
jgi:hypothetical protein